VDHVLQLADAGDDIGQRGPVGLGLETCGSRSKGPLVSSADFGGRVEGSVAASGLLVEDQTSGEMAHLPLVIE